MPAIVEKQAKEERMLPEGWSVERLGNVVTIGSGQVDPREEPYSSMLHVGAEDIESGTGRLLQPQTCSELGLISGKYEFDEHAVIYSKIRPHLNKVCFPGARGVCSADAYPLWPKPNVLLPKYLKYVLLSPDFVKYAVSCSMRTGMPKINREDLLASSIPIPSIREQEEIATILEHWDIAISSTERLLANRFAQKLALLAKFGMPVPKPGRGRASGGAYPPSVQPGVPKLPPTPSDWRKTTLAQHLTEVVRPAALIDQESYTLVTVRRSRGGVDKRSVLLGSQIKTPTQFYVKSGDFLISKRQIVHGACGIVPEHLDGAVVSNEYAVLNTDDRLDARFLAYLAETTYFQQTCFHSSIGVHIEKMLFNLDRWLSWPFNIPPLEVQLRIVEQLDAASKEIRLAERQVELLKTEKQALMADLLTGKRRVRTAAKPAQAQEPA
ncbi:MULTISPECIES: restriction endonuclease subunit S [Hydrogenophaga]|nr:MULTISPECIES: restriction endonuclease subunit S [Hydrogenophaga]